MGNKAKSTFVANCPFTLSPATTQSLWDHSEQWFMVMTLLSRVYFTDPAGAQYSSFCVKRIHIKSFRERCKLMQKLPKSISSCFHVRSTTVWHTFVFNLSIFCYLASVSLKKGKHSDLLWHSTCHPSHLTIQAHPHRSQHSQKAMGWSCEMEGISHFVRRRLKLLSGGPRATGGTCDMHKRIRKRTNRGADKCRRAEMKTECQKRPFVLRSLWQLII